MAATTRSAPAPSHAALHHEFRPFRDFVGPARRRTDHPLVVGTIVLCLGMSALSGIIQIAAVFWAGSQVKTMLVTQKAQADENDVVRKAFLKGHEAQAMVLRRVCLNTAKDDSDRRECLALIGPAPEGVLK